MRELHRPSLEVELESIREGGVSGDGEVDDAVRSSIAYNQLEKHNDRLKEALIKWVSSLTWINLF